MSRPLTLVLDVTERCNLRCVMCHFSRVDRIHFPPFEVVPPDHGNMPVPLFERIAAQFFPRARRVALACAAEPLMHPRFRELLAVASRHGVPELWFPTNLLALTEPTAEAIVRSNVTTIAVSIDGITKPTYEKIRTGASWERLHAKLQILRDAQRAARAKTPRLRLIFTWMRSNRPELRDLPEFAAGLGARELDVRYVAPAVGVDISNETLAREDPRELRDELAVTAHDAVRRGLRLAAWPRFDERPAALLPRIAWRFWRLRAGLDRLEDLAIARHERETGCRYPDRSYVIRPSGAVFPCEYHNTPVGHATTDTLLTIAKGDRLTRIREGLQCGKPKGSCETCGSRRDALY
ncbi:MAG TPA: radical SAM protein [Thermoanaerobaculia bacterium]|jgi:MoaA/NifB/PqqE/SkfB family radical SAM enzyme